VLFTFNVELRGVSRVELQRVTAVMLSEIGDVVECENAEQWLPATVVGRAAPPDAWQRLFAHWVPQRHREVQMVAELAMRREADHAIGDLRQQTDRATSNLRDWLHRRAEVICGKRELVTSDLFGAAPQGPEWRFAAAPLERLAQYAADAGNSLERRREADSTIQSFHSRAKDLAAYADVAEPMLYPIGMLMLVPLSRA
jgi:hypothetical protein